MKLTHPHIIILLIFINIIIIVNNHNHNILILFIILIFWFFLSIYNGNYFDFLKIIIALLPMYAIMCITWGVFKIGNYFNGYYEATEKTLFILNLSLSFKLFLDAAIDDPKNFFAMLGFRNSKLIILCGISSSIIEVKRRMDQLIIARYSRGKVKRRNMFYTLMQIPFIIKPLVITVIETAIVRAENLEQKNILHGIYFKEFKKKEFNFSDVLVILFILSILLVKYQLNSYG